ncbi:MAG TPA: molybdenum cofactor guanylyltransferase [Terrimicrobiaceae bacterium]
MRKFAAVLMAGGQSRRMGVDKALLDYHGKPLWCLQMEKLTQLGPEQLFFSVRQQMEFPSGSWRFVHDHAANMGPLGGLEAALRLTSDEFLVALAVDMPAMTAKFLSTLLEKAGPAGVVPHFNGFYHGASAVYPIRILPLVERVLQSADRSFQHLIREALPLGIMKAQEIEPAESGLFENWNSPDDL